MLGRRATSIITHDILYSGEPFTRVKLSGLFCEEDVRAVNEARPDLCGFVVDWPSSHRHVGLGKLRGLVHRLDPTIPAVGVFCNQPLGMVAELADEVLDVVELQGDEDNAYITFLTELADVPIIQTIHVHDASDIERANDSRADIVMLNSSWGSSRPFDWLLVGGLARPYILSGGLNERNVGAAIARLHPWGVNIDSGIESDRLNDPDKICDVVAAVRATDGG